MGDPEQWPLAVKKVELLRSGGELVDEEWQLQRKDGSRRTVLTSARLLGFEQQMSLVVFVIEDITEKKQAEQREKEMEAQVRQQEKLESLGLLVSGVAHEINNPINGIMNYAEIIRETAAPESEVHQFAEEIVSETHRVANLVKSLLAFARQDKGEIHEVTPAEVVDRTITVFSTIIKRDRIHVEKQVPDDLPVFRCRPQQIQQVLMNLLTNARDALNAKYPEHDPDKIIRLTGALLEDEAGRWIRFTVEDHGPGIPPEVQQRMFEPFHTTKPSGKGTGLGLGIVHGIVTEHGGRVHYETEVGRFTRFLVDLPLEGPQDVGRSAGPRS